MDHDMSIGVDLLSAALDESGLTLDDLNPGVEETHILNSDITTSGGIVGQTWDHITYPGSTLTSNHSPFPRPVQMPRLTTHSSVGHDQGLVQNLLLNSTSVQHLLSGGSATAINKNNEKAVMKMTLPSTSSNPPAMAPLHGSNDIYKPVLNSLTNKDVSRLWSNDDIKLRAIASPAVNTNTQSQLPPVLKEATEEYVEEEEEDLGHAETYSNYKPSKLRLGIEHPDSVVETNSLSSVQPPDVWYKLSIPESTIDYGHLSALQLEAMVYACQQHETFLADASRAGYLIGDGAGVGKGRTIAGIIYENYLLGRKRSLWLSVSNDLKYDAQRDLKDIGAGKIDVHSLNKFKYAKISSKVNGSVKKGVIFSTYSSLIGESQSGGKYRTRLKQLLHWCGEDFDGLIVFDECHKAKNLCPVGSSKPTKTGQTVLDLQRALPKARIVYASATGASEPKNMAYMVRLGIWGIGTPFREFNDFIQAVERRGVGAMEIVAMDIKLRGMYIARQLSFSGVTFKVEEIPLTKEFVEMYDLSVRLWVESREKFQLCADLIDAEHRMRKSMWGQFWSAHQRFFKYLCIASKVHHAVNLAKEAVRNGKCAVIGLQSTGEARTLEQLEDAGGELNDFVSTAKGVFQTLIEKHFPAPNRKKTFDLFGLSSYIKSEQPAKLPNSKSKRKTEGRSRQGSKRRREDKGSNDSEDDKDTGSDFNPSDCNESSESDLSSAEPSESEVESDFNPFGEGSGSDDDPWLNRKSKNKPTKNKKTKKSSVKKKESNTEKNHLSHGSLSNSINNNINGSFHSIAGMDAVERAQLMKQELIDKIEILGERLPPNTLDQLIDELGGPENVAEMTGRKGRVVSNDDGSITYESRSEVDVPLETLNLTEKQRFMDGDKNIAIISEAASSGISLQSDRRAKNQRRRVHITLELPWSADRAIQQFGRTHRSNQVNAPEYVFMISELAGERRFTSIVAKRLESLGALTHGDRRATETRDLSKFNFDNKYGRTALEAVMKSVIQQEAPLVPPPLDYRGDFFSDIRKALIGVGLITYDEKYRQIQLDKDYNNMSKFLNRILGIEVEMQNRLFKYFTDTLAAVIQHAKRNGRWDLGILDLGSGGDHVKKIETRTFVGKFSSGMAATELHMVSVERGFVWESALDLWRGNSGNEDGFYLSLQIRNNKRTSILAVAMATKKKRERLFDIYRPNTGLQIRGETLEEIRKKYKRVTPDEAQPYWQDQYDASVMFCSHAYWRGYCKRVSLNLPCDIGLRTRTYHILSGSVLSVWGKVEAVLAAMPGGHNSKMQIIRVKTDQGQRIVGTLIPGNCVGPLIHSLSQEATKTYVDSF